MTSLVPSLASVLAIAFAVQSGFASAGNRPYLAREAGEVGAEPTLTSKERLSGKASDDQRVDNCKVPLNLRGPKPRPDACADGVSTRPRR